LRLLPIGYSLDRFEPVRRIPLSDAFFKIGGAKLTGHCPAGETHDAARLPLSGGPKRAILVSGSPETRECGDHGHGLTGRIDHAR
jgi:hypothetical protein